MKDGHVLTRTRRRQLLALLLTPLLLLATGFRDTTTIEIESIDRLTVSIDQGIDYGYASREYGSVEEMCSEHMDTDSSHYDPYEETTVVPYEQDALWGCRFIGVITPENYSLDLSEVDGEFHMLYTPHTIEPTERGRGPLGLTGAGDGAGDLRISFTFPGDVIESTAGQVHGDTVTFRNLMELSNGAEIRAETGQAHDEIRDETSGFPWLIVVAVTLALILGTRLLLALAGAGLLIGRARQGTDGDPGAGTPASADVLVAAPSEGPQDQQWEQDQQGGRSV